MFYSRAPAVPPASLCSRTLGCSGGSSDPWGCPRLPQAEMSCGQWLLQAGVSLSPRHLDLARFGTSAQALSISAGFKSRKAAKDEGDAVLSLWGHWIPLLHGGVYPGGVGWAEARLSLAGAGEILGQVLGKQVWERGRERDGDTTHAVGDRVGAPVLAVSGRVGALVFPCWEWQELMVFPAGRWRRAPTVLSVCPNPSSALLPAEPP